MIEKLRIFNFKDSNEEGMTEKETFAYLLCNTQFRISTLLWEQPLEEVYAQSMLVLVLTPAETDLNRQKKKVQPIYKRF